MLRNNDFQGFGDSVANHLNAKKRNWYGIDQLWELAVNYPRPPYQDSNCVTDLMWERAMPANSHL